MCVFKYVNLCVCRSSLKPFEHFFGIKTKT